MSPPANLTLPCTDLETTTSSIGSWLASVTASDLCDPDLIVNNDFDMFNLNLCTPGVTTVTWTATDDCNNSTIVMADLIIEGDVAAPVFTFTPAPLEIDCNNGDITLGNWLNSAAAADACDPDISVTNDYDPTAIDICNGGGTTTVTWTATDACGNSSTTSSTITITEDNTAPDLTVPDDIILDCNVISETSSPALVIDSLLAAVQFSDLCDPSPVLTTSFSDSDLNVCADAPYDIEITFTVTDACGNTSTDVTIISIIPDTEAPTFNVPDDIVLDCSTLASTIDPATIIDSLLSEIRVFDNCDTDPVLSNDFNINDINLCTDETTEIVVTFIATDACGNTSTATSMISIEPDISDPTIVCPGSTLGDAPFFDCESDITWIHPDTTQVMDDCGIRTYTYSITDPDGTINGPFDILNLLTGRDLDPASFEANFDFEEGVSVVSYYVEDACGNNSSCQFEVTVGDPVAPFFLDCPSDLFVGNDVDECSGKVNWEVPIAWDNCDIPADPDVIEQDTSLVVSQLIGIHNGTTYEDIQSGDVIPVGTFTIGYVVVDTDGNTDTCEFNITVWDTQDPILMAGIPADITLSCEIEHDTFVLNQSHVRDNCVEDLTIENTIVSTRILDPNDCGYYNYQDTFFYTVTDSAQVLSDGTAKVNQSVWKQVVTRIDTTPPSIVVPPDTLIQECQVTPIETCITEELIIGTKDSTVNVGGEWVVLTIVEKKDTLICETIFQPIPFEDQDYGIADVIDNCAPNDSVKIVNYADFQYGDGDFLLTFRDEITPVCKGDKAFEVNRIWIAKDPCGNIDSIIQVLEIIDRNPPEIFCKEEITVSLDTDGSFHIDRDDVLFDYFDACFTNPADIDVLTQPNFFNCQDIGSHTVLVSATDVCNNETSFCEVTVNVVDIIAPTILCPQTPVVLSLDPRTCDAAFDLQSYIQSEDCDVQITTDPPINGGLPAGISTVVITATDASGNSNSCSIEVDVQLTEEIEFDVTLGCNDLLNVSLPSDCELALTPDLILEGTPDICTDLLCIEVRDPDGNPHINFFDISDVDEVFTVRIVDCNGSGNSCWASVRIEEKLIPEVEYPRDTTILCLEPQDPEYHKLGYPTILNCETSAEITFTDNYIEFDQCSDPRAVIERTWFVTDDDAQMHRDTHTQIITIVPFSNEHVTFPPDITAQNALDCHEVSATLDDIENGILSPTSVLHPDSTGLPSAFGIPLLTNAGLCLFNVGYEDEVLEGCGSTFSILRTWKILDVCQGASPTNPIEHTQIIVVLDSDAPEVFGDTLDLLVSIDPWTCAFAGMLPIPEYTESCGTVSFDGYVSGGGFIDISDEDGEITATGFNFYEGTHTVNYVFKDACGNISLFEFDVVVIDNVPPVAVCQENIQVALTGNQGVDGVAKVYAQDIDGGSHDSGCSEVSTCLIRLIDFNAGALEVLVDGNRAYNAINSCSIDGELQDTTFNKNGEVESISSIPYVLCKDEIKLCCQDAGNQELVLIATDENGLANSCITTINVVDNSASALNCEPHTIDCTEDSSIDVLSPIGENTLCGEDVNVAFIDDSEFLDGCGEGQIFRIWYFDLNDNQQLDEGENSCNQVITIINAEGFDPFTLKWPKHYTGETFNGINLECNDDGEVITNTVSIEMGNAFSCSASDFGMPAWCNTSCGLVGVSSEIDTVATSDACLELINRWTVIDWCTWDANEDDIDDENDTDNDVFEAVEDWAQGQCTGCQEGISSDPVYFRYSEVDADGYYTYDQVIKIIDDVAPTVELEDLIVTISDGRTSKDDDLICSATGVLNATASDFCGDTVVSGDALRWQISYDNGESVETSVLIGASISLESQAGSPGDSHTVNLIVSDGCGNESSAIAVYHLLMIRHLYQFV
jgi:hypothetical protein